MFLVNIVLRLITHDDYIIISNNLKYNTIQWLWIIYNTQQSLNMF